MLTSRYQHESLSRVRTLSHKRSIHTRSLFSLARTWSRPLSRFLSTPSLASLLSRLATAPAEDYISPQNEREALQLLRRLLSEQLRGDAPARHAAMPPHSACHPPPPIFLSSSLPSSLPVSVPPSLPAPQFPSLHAPARHAAMSAVDAAAADLCTPANTRCMRVLPHTDPAAAR